jgi:hypothetical protein
MDPRLYPTKCKLTSTRNSQIPAQAPSYCVFQVALHLIEIIKKLDPAKIFLNQQVREIKVQNNQVQVIQIALLTETQPKFCYSA